MLYIIDLYHTVYSSDCIWQWWLQSGAHSFWSLMLWCLKINIHGICIQLGFFTHILQTFQIDKDFYRVKSMRKSELSMKSSTRYSPLWLNIDFDSQILLCRHILIHLLCLAYLLTQFVLCSQSYLWHIKWNCVIAHLNISVCAHSLHDLWSFAWPVVQQR